MVRCNADSDSESDVLSTDSLEIENKNSSRHEGGFVNDGASATVPYYKGEITIPEVRKTLLSDKQNKPNKNSSYSNKRFNFKNQNLLQNIRHSERRSPSFTSSYINSNSYTSFSARAEDRFRLGGRKSTLLENTELFRPRHKSVSYLEQYRKKIYGVGKVDSSVYSTAGSDLSICDRNSSYFGSEMEESITSPSELQFYEDIIKNTENIHVESNIQTNKITPTSASTKSQKGYKVKKVESLVLSKEEVGQAQEKWKCDKRSSFERREAYANKVKLRNQEKIRKQKEREKQNMIKDATNQNSHTEDCMYYSSSQTRKTAVKGSGEPSVPFVKNVLVDSTINSRSRLGNRRSAKQNQTGIIRIKKVKEDDLSKLKTLQQRHESEKMIVDSIRHIVLKI